MNDTVRAYDDQAALLAARYEGTSAEAVHAPLLGLLPAGTGKIALDIGAGSGRDAAWLARLGFDVVAAEPAAGMRKEGQRLHPHDQIRWLDDRLPDLSAVHSVGLSYDLILLTAVWMHVAPPTRARAFRKVVTLLKPGGLIFISLRDGPPEAGRPMWPAPAGEIEALARSHGLAVLKVEVTADKLSRPDVQWTTMCLRMPDDGAGALPLIRGVILNDEKSSTYKLGLLRAVARIADTAPGLARPRLDEDVVDVPLGLVALNWLRMYLPLVAAGLPQLPGNSGPEGLGFAKAGFRELLHQKIVSQDLRPGARFGDQKAVAVVQALAEARRTIVDMPANFMRFPNSNARVFTADPVRLPRLKGGIVLDGETLGLFGTLAVPGHIWRTLQRLGAWIEPVLVSEWARLVRSYGERMSRPISAGTVEATLAWLEPTRDTLLARDKARQLLGAGQHIMCVWSGAKLDVEGLDIDHCLPWSAWPCGDLWNLLPTSRRVNQHLKRDKLPSARALAAARDSILSWWEAAWQSDPGLAVRFDRESAAALPIGHGAAPAEIFAGLEWRRLQLRQDQQIAEWHGAGPPAS